MVNIDNVNINTTSDERMVNIQTSAHGFMTKTWFSLIPDTRNTRWFWKLIGYGSSIEKYFGFGSGIGYPLVPGHRCTLHSVPTFCHSHNVQTSSQLLCAQFWLVGSLSIWSASLLQDILFHYVRSGSCGQWGRASTSRLLNPSPKMGLRLQSARARLKKKTKKGKARVLHVFACFKYYWLG